MGLQHVLGHVLLEQRRFLHEPGDVRSERLVFHGSHGTSVPEVGGNPKARKLGGRLIRYSPRMAIETMPDVHALSEMPFPFRNELTGEELPIRDNGRPLASIEERRLVRLRAQIDDELTRIRSANCTGTMKVEVTLSEGEFTLSVANSYEIDIVATGAVSNHPSEIQRRIHDASWALRQSLENHR